MPGLWQLLSPACRCPCTPRGTWDSGHSGQIYGCLLAGRSSARLSSPQQALQRDVGPVPRQGQDKHGHQACRGLDDVGGICWEGPDAALGSAPPLSSS
jgi:hypothetical protein